MTVSKSKYNRYVTVLLFVMTGLLFAGNVPAQIPAFRNYNVRNGLPSSETYCVAQDKNGYILIGTDRGLARFDGHKFEILTTNDGLLDNTIFLLKRMGDQVWYYTYNSLIGCLGAGGLYEYPYNRLMKQLNPKGVFKSVVLDRKGTLWLSKIRWPHSGKKSVHSITGITSKGGVDTSLSSPVNDQFTNVYISDSGHCLVSGHYFMNRVRLYALDSRELLLEFHSKGKDPYDVLGIYRNGKAWLYINGQIMTIADHKVIRTIPCSGSVLYLWLDKSENLWVCHRDHGVWIYNPGDNYTKPVKWLEEYSVSCMLKDNEGGMWFTTLENGVYYLPPDHLLSHNRSTGLYSDKTVKIGQLNEVPVILTSDRQLQIYDTMHRHWEPLFPKGSIVSVVPGPEQVFFSTIPDYSNKLSFKKFREIGAAKIIHVNQHVWSIHDDGIVRFNTLGQELKEYFIKDIPLVTSLLELANDSVLIGTINGLYMLGKNNMLTSIKLPANHKIVRISDIKKVNERYYVVSTAGQGLFIIDSRNNQVINHISASNGLKSEIVNVLCADKNNNLWIGTSQGLGKISDVQDTSDFACQWLDMHDGLVSNEINDMCIIKNDLWLATNGGITILPLSKDLTNTTGIPVLMKRIVINGKPRSNITAPLSYTDNNISFEFTGLSHQYADAVRYKYRLINGSAASWNFTENPVVNYSNLNPGNYQFEYAALAPNQRESATGNSFRFTIGAPFWQAGWFIGLTALFGLILVYAIVHIKIRTIKRRMHIAADLNRYRDKALREQMSPHFIYNSLNAIQSYILKSDQKNSLLFLNKFARLMRHVFNNTVQDLIPLAKDLEALGLYAALERMRFQDRLSIILPEILPDHLQNALIPPQLIQPFVENAILHGLLPQKEHPGRVEVTITQAAPGIKISIRDNGIGRAMANELKIRKLKYYAGRDTGRKREHSGTTVTIARIAQIWQQQYDDTKFGVTDLYNEEGKPSGTLVVFYLPLITHDKSNNSR